MMSIIKNSMLLIALLILSSCQNSDEPSPPDYLDTPLNKVSLKPLADCSTLKSKVVDNWIEGLLSPYRYQGMMTTGIAAPMFDSSAPSAAGAAEYSNSSPDQVSQTNVQEQGVDEADKVKAGADGHLYIAHQNYLLIQQAFPPGEMKQLAQLDLGGRVRGLYLQQSSSTIIAQVERQALLFESGAMVMAETMSDSMPMSTTDKPAFDIVFIDVSDRAKPLVKNRIRIDGWLVSSRRIGNRLHLLSRLDIYPHYSLYSDQNIQTLLIDYQKHYSRENKTTYSDIASQIRTLLLSKIDTLDIKTLLPKVSYPLATDSSATPALDCSSIHAPDVAQVHSGLMTVSSVDLSAENLSQVGLLGNGWMTYATQNDFFFAEPSSGWWWTAWQQQQTVIHHFSLTATQPEYRASAVVTGYINDSFSMSYRDDNLRVATTANGDNQTQAFAPSNHLFILRNDNAGGMQLRGSVDNFAPGERIFSARFFDDKAFVVTFRQVDPLFAFDLSNPDNPVIASELKIPGFSRYIHPVDTNTLLTIGRDGDDTGVTDNIAVKLFDVSDLGAVRLLDSYVPDVGGYSWSAANWDHHAFTYYAPLSLLSIPLSSYDWNTDASFNGLLALKIDLVSGQIEEEGRVNHLDLAQQYCNEINPDYCDYGGYTKGWLSQVERSVIMQGNGADYLYSLSQLGLKATNLASFAGSAGTLLFPQPDSIGHYYLY